MATAISNPRCSAQTTILIVAENLPDHNRTYTLASTVSLKQVMETWMEDCDQVGYWIFTSAEGSEYNENLSLEMIGETVSGTGLIYLRVELSDRYKEIFVNVKDECYHLWVESDDLLYDVLRNFLRSVAWFESNSSSLNLHDTILKNGLENNAIVGESRPQKNITVTLSEGMVRTINLPENSLVLQLLEIIQCFVVGEFSLEYQSRILNNDESVNQLEHVVKVIQNEFIVSINNQRVRWKSHGGTIPFPRFLSQLSIEGQLKQEQLETMDFFCTGCQRRISQSDEDVQMLPVECCKVRSKTLIARSPSETRTYFEANKIQCLYELIESVQEQIASCESIDKSTEDLRHRCRLWKEKCRHENLDYNKIIQISERLKTSINRLNEKIKALEFNIEKLKIENNKASMQIKSCEEENAKGKMEIHTLKENNAKLSQELKTSNEKNVKAIDDLQMLKLENAQSLEEIKKLKRRTPHPSETSVEDHRTKLYIMYDHDYFTAVVSRPEVRQDVKYPYYDFASQMKCEVPGLHPGINSFEDVLNVLQPLFSGKDIFSIDQRRGSKYGTTVVEVTSRINDEREEQWGQREFCSSDGNLELTWKEAGKPLNDHKIRNGGEIIISGGQRRTVLWISAHTDKF